MAAPIAMTGFGETSYKLLSFLCFIVLLHCGTTHGQEVTSSPLCGSTRYDMETLKALPYWTVTKPGICYDSWGKVSRVCVIKLAFCKSLPLSETGSIRNVGAAQLAIGPIGAKPLILGMMSQIEDDNSGNRLLVAYPDGSQVNCGTMSVIMYLSCNPDNQWQLPISVEPAEIPGLTEVALDNSNTSCVYSIFADYAGACEVQVSTGLSAGSILIIIFICFVTIYLVGGVIYNRVQGATGLKLIPNYEMWRNFPDTVVTGCDFFFKTITCQGGATASSDGYDQI